MSSASDFARLTYDGRVSAPQPEASHQGWAARSKRPDPRQRGAISSPSPRLGEASEPGAARRLAMRGHDLVRGRYPPV